MTYQDELDHLVRAVATLVEKPEKPLDELGVQAALSSRKALLGLLTVQMAEAAPLDRSATKPDLQRLAEHPVAAFIGALREYPRPHGEIAPSVLYSRPQETPAGALWLEVGRRSTLAQAEWQGTGQPLTDEQAWSTVGDAAALAGALARLDEDLRAAAQKAGCDDLVQALAPPAALRLVIAASEVRGLAGPGTRTTTPDRWRTPEPRIHPVVRDSDVPGALEALTALLRNARVLKPEHVQQITITLARLELRLHRGITTDLARELAVAAQTPRRAACPFHGDRRPLLQAAELNRWATGSGPGPVATIGVDGLLSRCVIALHAAVQRQLQLGHWLVPNQDPGRQTAWRTWDHSQPTPQMLTALKSAVAAVSAADRRGDRPSTRRPARVLLHESLSSRGRRRPVCPQTRPVAR
jgi:hypothetical protein